jgi:membrane protease YdiL (CAAX protease family)
MSRGRRWLAALGLLLWVLAGFGISVGLTIGLMWLATVAGIDLGSLNENVLSTVIAAFTYVLTLVIVIGVPYGLNRRTTRPDLGLTRLPNWMDILLAPAGFIIYLLASGIIVTLVAELVPGFDTNEAQEVGFTNLTYTYQYILAFITLVVVAPIAEEVLFRGYLYGKLRRVVSMWLAILLTSVVFGVVHGQWNVGIDVFVLSIVMCGLREMTGNIWAGILLHMMKNGLAFYLLFINPSLLNTIGG